MPIATSVPDETALVPLLDAYRAAADPHDRAAVQAQIMDWAMRLSGDTVPPCPATRMMVERYCEAAHHGWWDTMTPEQRDEERRRAAGLLAVAVEAP